MKMIKLSFNDNDFKVAHLSDFFSQSDDNDNFLNNQRTYTSYLILLLLCHHVHISSAHNKLENVSLTFSSL